ncbi:OmpA family protein [Lysobacter panacisoli]|uniref:Outer membrane protein assembly factor BamE n=1 Tax=Lysobacter panacisoli TaxID=1255263 RepID=A0ABP9LB80_9GAMM|nr:OmpA family protein [Lysobacter panacisoli]
MNTCKKSAIALVLTAFALGSIGCTQHVSRDVSDAGQVVGEVTFPSLDHLVLKEGTFPTREALSQIAPGVTKDQLYALIGRPHFREGFGHVTEWDYLFHFRAGSQVTTCQYKVVFDEHEKGQSFHWLPESCLAPAAAAARRPQEPASEKRFTLSADALFSFGSSSLGDRQSTQDELASIAQELAAANAPRVQVIGHTDRIGDEHSNDVLSQRRANTVREFLVRNGVPAEAIVAVGKGEREPVSHCAASLSRTDLVACLQPDRRVEIIVEGSR